MHAELYRAGAMELALSGQVGVVGEFSRHEGAEVVLRAIYGYLSCPVRPVLADAKDSVGATGFWTSLILHVPGLRNIPQITNSVVAWVPINMVDAFSRPKPKLIEPRQSVPSVGPAFHADLQIPSVVASGNVSRVNVSCESCTPRKHPSFWVVMKNFTQTLCGKIGLSHDVLQLLIGQRPARVISTGGPRHFITRSSSWIAKTTKCLYRAASKTAGFRMPTNHCGPFHPRGALAPLNAYS